MSETLIVILLALAVVAAAALSFLAWHRLSRGPRTNEEGEFDSDGADV